MGELVDDVEVGVGAEHLWHVDAFGCLVVFKESSHNAGECKGGAVESVAELGFAVFSTEAAFEAVGLVCFEVRYG